MSCATATARTRRPDQSPARDPFRSAAALPAATRVVARTPPAPEPGEENPSPADVGVEYSKYAEALLAAQDGRKASLEQRGLAVITTSGTLVTLVFGLVAVLTKANSYKLPHSAHGWIGAALIAFVIAAVLGLASNVPLNYGGADFDDEETLKAVWEDEAVVARRRVTETRLGDYRQAQKRNGFKAGVLVAGMGFEVGAVILLSIAVGNILHSS
jgi:hypothetical protein